MNHETVVGVVAVVLAPPCRDTVLGSLSEIDRVGKEALIKLRKFYVICSLVNRSSILRIIPRDVYITLILDRWLIIPIPADVRLLIIHGNEPNTFGHTIKRACADVITFPWACHNFLTATSPSVACVFRPSRRVHPVQILHCDRLFAGAQVRNRCKEGRISHSAT